MAATDTERAFASQVKVAARKDQIIRRLETLLHDHAEAFRRIRNAPTLAIAQAVAIDALTQAATAARRTTEGD